MIHTVQNDSIINDSSIFPFESKALLSYLLHLDMDLQHSELHVPAVYLDIFTAPGYPQLATLLEDMNPVVGNI